MELPLQLLLLLLPLLFLLLHRLIIQRHCLRSDIGSRTLPRILAVAATLLSGCSVGAIIVEIADYYVAIPAQAIADKWILCLAIQRTKLQAMQCDYVILVLQKLSEF